MKTEPSANAQYPAYDQLLSEEGIIGQHIIMLPVQRGLRIVIVCVIAYYYVLGFDYVLQEDRCAIFIREHST